MTDKLILNYYIGMKITIEYMGFFRIEDVPSNSTIEVEPHTTVSGLLDNLKVKPEHRTYIRPIVNREKKSFEYTLQEGDNLFLYFPIGGG